MLTDYRLRVSELKGTAKLLSLVHSAKIPNCSTYKFQLEDHTLGNLMRAYLMKQSEIKYSGYKNIHPLKEQLELKIQTKNQPVVDIFKSTLSNLQKQLQDLEVQFDKNFKL